jgi:Golgi nucleoside diphosphatase
MKVASLLIFDSRTSHFWLGSILTNVRQKLRASGFRFPDDANARVISGEEEGTFGWIAVNFLLQTFAKGPSATVGALDMGGASVRQHATCSACSMA